jgi:hypothetical protein
MRFLTIVCCYSLYNSLCRAFISFQRRRYKSSTQGSGLKLRAKSDPWFSAWSRCLWHPTIMYEYKYFPSRFYKAATVSIALVSRNQSCTTRWVFYVFFRSNINSRKQCAELPEIVKGVRKKTRPKIASRHQLVRMIFTTTTIIPFD